MIDSELTHTFDSFTNTIDEVTNLSLLTNFVINFLVAASMNLLWGIFHTL